MIQFVVANKAVLLGFGWALCEVLNLIPGVKANSTFQLIYNGLTKAKEAVIGKSETPKAE